MYLNIIRTNGFLFQFALFRNGSRKNSPMIVLRAGPSRRGAQQDVGPNATQGPSEQWFYYVIVLSHPCYDLFDDDISAK